MNDMMQEVRKDVFCQMKNNGISEETFALMTALLTFLTVSRNEGLLALEEIIPQHSQLDQYEEVEQFFSYMIKGTNSVVLIELMTNEYWCREPQGVLALHYYFIMTATVRIQEGATRDLLEMLFLSCVSKEDKRKYKIYCGENNLIPKVLSPKERLLSEEATELNDSELINLKHLLDNEVRKRTEAEIKGTIEKMDDIDVVLALKGMSIETKKNILHSVSEKCVDRYAELYECMGPVRKMDIVEAMAKMKEAVWRM